MSDLPNCPKCSSEFTYEDENGKKGIKSELYVRIFVTKGGDIIGS